jgi:hypothetical protein
MPSRGRRLVFALAMFAACAPAPDCTTLASERSLARATLRDDEDLARLGDAYARASLAYDRDRVRVAEKRYDAACLK